MNFYIKIFMLVDRIVFILRILELLILVGTYYSFCFWTNVYQTAYTEFFRQSINSLNSIFISGYPAHFLAYNNLNNTFSICLYTFCIFMPRGLN